MSLNLVYTTNKSILWQEVHGEYVLLDPISSKTHELNELAFFIWNNFSKDASIEFITQEVLQEYDIDEENATKDTRLVTERFLESGIITRVNEDN